MPKSQHKSNSTLAAIIYLASLAIFTVSIVVIVATAEDQQQMLSLPRMCQLTALRGCYEPSNGVVELTVNRAIVEGDKYVLQYVIFDITGMSCGDIEESMALSELIACVPHPNVTIDVVFPARVTHLRHARFHSSFTLNYVSAGFGLIATMLLTIAAYKVDPKEPSKPNKSTYSEL